MDDFNFIHREEELEYTKETIKENNFSVYYYSNNSGLTHYLKKLQLDLCEDGYVCFYVNCDHEKSAATQIAEQIISGCNHKEVKKYTKKKSEVAKKIIKTFATSIDIVPILNIGSLAFGLIDSINDTTDVDMRHITDYKIEKAIVNLFHKLEKNEKYRNVCLLFDDSSKLSTVSLEFLAKILSTNYSKILFTIPYSFDKRGIEKLSKIAHFKFSPIEIDKVFKCPDNRLICGLFSYYQKNYKEEYLELFERHDRNIHIIMSHIRGFNMKFSQLDLDTLFFLKILILLETHINIRILEGIYNRVRYVEDLSQVIPFNKIVSRLEAIFFIAIDRNKNVYLNKKLISETEIPISLIDRITITKNIIHIFEMHKYELTIHQLKFAVLNLDKDYNRRKSYLLTLLVKQKAEKQVEQQYLDMLFYLDNNYELLETCCMYYNLQVYDVPYIRIKQHSEFSNDREYQILFSLLQERLHTGEYSNSIEKLVENSANRDEQCLLVAVLFTAWFNEGKSNNSQKILYDDAYKYHYKRFGQSNNYHYLLRNISYYIEKADIAIDNYNYCLSKFINLDPVNYNRTMSNFICYLMKHDNDKYAKIVLDEKIEEVKKILEFNDPKYLYLNINYGIYLMREDKGNPSRYFESILSESGTTETPYIYAQINYALYISKTNPAKALIMLDKIFHQNIRETKVVPTKIFYQINRILVEYMNGIYNMDLLLEIKNNPLRGDYEYAEKLYKFYSHRFKQDLKYVVCDWRELFLPGYIFYHGVAPELLLPSLERPSSKM